MKHVTFTNAQGESVVFYNSAPFLITKLDGTGAPTSTIQMQRAPYQYGETYVRGLLDPRYLSLEGAILGRSREDTFSLRNKLTRVLNTKLGMGTLQYLYNGGLKEIPAVPDHSPIFPDQNATCFQAFLVSFVCPSPYWLDTYTTSREMSYIMGGYKFSLRLPVSFSKRSFQRGVENVGDVETPVKIEFKGPAQNPTVYNRTTGEFVRVKRDLGENDVLHIDTEFGKKRVEIVRASGTVENAFHYIDLASTFFTLVVGKNKLEYNSNNDSSKTKVTVSYRNRYVGV